MKQYKPKISKKSKIRDQKFKKSKFSEWSPKVLGRFIWVRSDVKTIFYYQIEIFWKILKFGKLRLPGQDCVSHGGSGGAMPPQLKRGGLGGAGSPPRLWAGDFVPGGGNLGASPVV